MGKRHHQPSDEVAGNAVRDKASACFIPFKGALQSLFVKRLFSNVRGLRRWIDIPSCRSNVLSRCNKKCFMNLQSPNPSVRATLIDELAAALAAVRNAEEARSLLADLCTPAEVHSLAERWQVARLLDAGQLTYREIHEATGVSTTTIVRVARFLRQEENRGYRLLLDRLKEAGA
jgi:TrpR-related protein YerC/YecD